MSNSGQSRGNQKNKRFIQDSANSFVVESFRDVSETAPVSPVDGDGYIVEEAGSLHASWGAITGIQDKDIIRWRASKGVWEIVHAAVASNEGSESYVKEDDILYVFDGADWNIASGGGGGVKNFAQKQATSYKIADWTAGNGVFGTVTSAVDSVMSIDDTDQIEGKKSFLITTGAATENDWYYLTVDIDKYARGSALAFILDYQWDGEEDVNIKIFNAAFDDEGSTELTVLKNTENDYKLSRPSRVVYAHADDEAQVLVGFQFPAGISAGKKLRFDNLAVTDDIGAIGSGGQKLTQDGNITQTGSAMLNRDVPTFDLADLEVYGSELCVVETGTYGTQVRALVDCTLTLTWCPFAANPSVVKGVSEVLGSSTTAGASANEQGIATGTAKLKAGEYLRIRIGSTDIANNAQVNTMSFHAEAEQEGLRFLQVNNGEKLKDGFGAIVTNNGTAAVVDDAHSFIDSVVRIALGKVLVTYKPGFFSTTPAVNATGYNQASAQGYYSTENQTKDSVTIVSYQHLSGIHYILYDQNFNLQVERLGNDVAPDIVGVPVAIQGQTHEQDSMVRLNTGNGYGSTNTRILRFLNIEQSIGSAITYTDSATDGALFTIEETGFYAMSILSDGASATDQVGISRNSTELTTNIYNIAIADRLAYDIMGTANQIGEASWSGILQKGDQIRPHGTTALGASYRQFTISKVGTQPLLDGGVVITNEDKFQNSFAARFEAYPDPVNVYVDFQSAPWIQSVSRASAGVYNVVFTPNFFTEIPIVVGNSEYSSAVDGNVELQNITTAGCTVQQFFGTSSRLDRDFSLVAYRQESEVIKLSEVLTSYTSRVYKEDPIAWQKKTLLSAANAVGTLPALTFNNLEIGKTYRIILQTHHFNSLNISTDMEMRDGAIKILRSQRDPDSSTPDRQEWGQSAVFTATTETLEAYVVGANANSFFEPNDTWAILEELPFHAQTSKWT